MKKNSTVLIAMVVSIILLATSQWFWIKSEYGEQRRTLFTNSDLVFKETVRTLEDSLYSRAFAEILRARKEESEKPATPPVVTPKVEVNTPSQTKKYDTIQVVIQDTINPNNSSISKILNDTSSHLISILEDSSVKRLMVRVDSKNVTDSINHLKRIVTQLPRINNQQSNTENNNRSLRISRRRFSPLSASLDSVNINFNKKIKAVGYSLDFDIKKDSIPFDTTIHPRSWPSMTDLQKRLRSSEDSVMVNGVMILNPEIISSYSADPVVMYRAYPVNLSNYIYSKLRNNILFSSFLIIITLITFALIYRNLLRQQRLNDIKNELISNISHELKTPLSTLSVALEALQQFGLQAKPETSKEYLQISRNEVNRLSGMVDNILKTSLLEKHGFTIDPEPLNMKEVVEEVIRTWNTRLESEGHLIKMSAVGEDFTVNADRLQVYSILNNLIDNAIKYSEGKAEVQLHLVGSRDRVDLQVADKGIGIPKEYQKQIFDKFFRVPTGDRHNVKGYGLGLNFVKHIMELHQGSVRVNSNDNGTTFKLSFPRKV